MIMIDPRDLLDEEGEFKTGIIDKIYQQQRRRRIRVFSLIAVLCVIALVVGAVIGFKVGI